MAAIDSPGSQKRRNKLIKFVSKIRCGIEARVNQEREKENGKYHIVSLKNVDDRNVSANDSQPRMALFDMKSFKC